MVTPDPTQAGQRFQEALKAPRPARSFWEWENDVGMGWRPLIRGLDTNLRDLDPDYVIGQVKEKFGGLRYYLDAIVEEHREEAYRLIHLAEALSILTCEDCGGPGEHCTIGKFWIKTLCPYCHRDREDEREFDEANAKGELEFVEDNPLETYRGIE